VYYVNGPQRQVGAWIQVVVRTAGDPTAVIAPLREIVRAADPMAAVDEAGPLASSLARSIAEPRFFATVLSVFAAMALLLASIGLYGVLSYSVTLRRRELGVRAALGARRVDLLRMVVLQGLGAAGAGLAAGLVLAGWAARLMRTLLFGIEPIDLPTFAGGALVLLAVAVGASLIPARRAASSDPLEALRQQ
jgi:ABC-type antimicrobial peptide transport system permease subunit